MHWPDSYAPGQNLVLGAGRSGTAKCFPRRALAQEAPNPENCAPRRYRVRALQLVRMRPEPSRGRRFARPPNPGDKAPRPGGGCFGPARKRNLRTEPGTPPTLLTAVRPGRMDSPRARRQAWPHDLVRRPPKNITMPGHAELLFRRGTRTV